MTRDIIRTAILIAMAAGLSFYFCGASQTHVCKAGNVEDIFTHCGN